MKGRVCYYNIFSHLFSYFYRYCSLVLIINSVSNGFYYSFVFYPKNKKILIG
ncbi:hypothetical protein C1646_689600 [Rhizophagus diaphanus]|nr:hypothetical protein C1646_689600 [Rhizophagus diaphanus] [Rhizophagus sp. MUCL 43196]